jgi:acyl phosphate:glycerol-3-phosphate acyltransferase
MEWIALLLGAFVLGSIPFGYLIAKARGVDIRATGSGNIGATNVLRTLGRGPGLFVFLLDVSKGAVPAFAAYSLPRPEFLAHYQELAFLAGMAAVIGHTFSPFLGFRGGKGVATGLGAMLGTSPLVALCAFAIFLALLLATRYVSLSSIIAALLLPLWGGFFKDPVTLVVAYALFGLYIVSRHTSNIDRLRKGTERKFTLGKSEPPEERPASEAHAEEEEEEDRDNHEVGPHGERT